MASIQDIAHLTRLRFPTRKVNQQGATLGEKGGVLGRSWERLCINIIKRPDI
jgi:hypothetical protein